MRVGCGTARESGGNERLSRGGYSSSYDDIESSISCQRIRPPGNNMMLAFGCGAVSTRSQHPADSELTRRDEKSHNHFAPRECESMHTKTN